MQEGPNIARIATVIGDRARSQMLSILMSGRALTATELADAADISRPTASSHLATLERAGLVSKQNAGRHRYFRIASVDVAEVLETLMGVQYILEERRFGPRNPALRRARLCYDHLAGEIGVWIYDALEAQRAFDLTPAGMTLNGSGWRIFTKLGIHRCATPPTRRPMCRACLDWSERRNHLAGALGAVLMKRLIELRWAKVSHGSRIVQFSAEGERALGRAFRGLETTPAYPPARAEAPG